MNFSTCGRGKLNTKRPSGICTGFARAHTKKKKKNFLRVHKSRTKNQPLITNVFHECAHVSTVTFWNKKKKTESVYARPSTNQTVHYISFLGRSERKAGELGFRDFFFLSLYHHAKRHRDAYNVYFVRKHNSLALRITESRVLVFGFSFPLEKPLASTK